MSKFSGVVWNKSNLKWEAFIHILDVPMHIGLFDSELHAAQMHDIVSIRIKSCKALNFVDVAVDFDKIDEMVREHTSMFDLPKVPSEFYINLPCLN